MIGAERLPRMDEPPDPEQPRRLVPVRPRPREGELFASWLKRVANANGLSIHAFLKATWPTHGEMDWDGEPLPAPSFLTNPSLQFVETPAVLSLAASATGQREEALEKLPLRSSLREYSTMFILPAGRVPKRASSPHGESASVFYPDSFCPDCLAADAFLRRVWRAAFCCCCPVHRRFLLDRCPDCDASLGFYDESLETYHREIKGPPLRCHSCRYDLTTPVDPVADEVLAFQRFVLDLVEGAFVFRRKFLTDLPKAVLSTVHRLMEVFFWLEKAGREPGHPPPGEASGRRKQVADKSAYVFAPVKVRASLFAQACQLIEKHRDEKMRLTGRERHCLELLRPEKQRSVVKIARDLLPAYLRYETKAGPS